VGVGGKVKETFLAAKKAVAKEKKERTCGLIYKTTAIAGGKAKLIEKTLPKKKGKKKSSSFESFKKKKTKLKKKGGRQMKGKAHNQGGGNSGNRLPKKKTWPKKGERSPKDIALGKKRKKSPRGKSQRRSALPLNRRERGGW